MVFKKGNKVRLGTSHSNETKEKIRQTRIGKTHSKETLEKIRISSIGRKHTNEWRLYMSKVLTGKVRTTETLIKMSDSMKGKFVGKNNPFYGKKHTEETRKKLSELYIGKDMPFKNTKPERFLQSILSINQINYIINKKIYGRPDIFIEPNICIFVDGDYWHSLEKAINRDKKVNEYLFKNNYEVIRFSENNITKDINSCLNTIIRVMLK